MALLPGIAHCALAHPGVTTYPCLGAEGILVDGEKAGVGDDAVGGGLPGEGGEGKDEGVPGEGGEGEDEGVPGEGGEVGAEHERGLDDAPEGEHGAVLCLPHPALPQSGGVVGLHLPHKQGIRVVPPQAWALHTRASEPLLGAR